MISEIIHMLKTRQAELRLALAEGNAINFDSYSRMVGEYQGLQWTLDSIDMKLKEKE